MIESNPKTGVVDSDNIKTISASTVAGLLTTPPQGTEEAKNKGHLIHEMLSNILWDIHRCVIPSLDNFEYADDDKGGWECELCGEVFDWNYDYYQPEFTELKYCGECAVIMRLGELPEDVAQVVSTLIHHPLLKYGGRTPPTQHREIIDGIHLTAKADIITNTLDYVEIKTYPLDDYARAQARAEAWVYDEEITLIGVNGDTIEVEKIPIPKKSPINAEDIPINSLQDHNIFCSVCWDEGRVNCRNQDTGGCYPDSYYYDDDEDCDEY